MARRKLAPCSCGSWDEVLVHLGAARGRIGLDDAEQPWFRGATNREYGLEPTLFWRTKAARRIGQLSSIEQDLFFEFQAKARELHERGLSDWDYLFFMRHHGVPTRILDWTESFGVAVFFALWGRKAGETPCIWVINPWGLNEAEGWGRDAMQPRFLDRKRDYGELLVDGGRWAWKSPLAVYPLQIAERMRAQSGWFTMHGRDLRPLEQQRPEVVARLDLSPAAVEGARAFLDVAGLSEARLFPDLDHLATDLSRRIGI